MKRKLINKGKQKKYIQLRDEQIRFLYIHIFLLKQKQKTKQVTNNGESNSRPYLQGELALYHRACPYQTVYWTIPNYSIKYSLI